MMAKPLSYYKEKYIRHLPTRFCSGCGNGVILNSFVRALNELNISQDGVLCVSGIGCSAWIPNPHFQGDALHATHGRAIPFATGAKVFNRGLKTVIFTGDGDGAGIGGNHLIHAARRNIEMTTILVNNMNYGMTGGQIAPTTLHGDYTETSPFGNPENPFDLAELVAGAGATYVARWTTYHVVELTQSIKEALRNRGFSFIEVLSQCPTQQRRMFGMGGSMQEIPSRIAEMFSESTSIRGRTVRDSHFYVLPIGQPEEALKEVKDALSGTEAKARLVDHIKFHRVVRIDSNEPDKIRARLEDHKSIERIVDAKEGKIELGVFVRRDRPEFVESLHRLMDRAQGG